MEQEGEVLLQIKKQHKSWKCVRNAFNTVVAILGITAIVTSVIVSVYTGNSDSAGKVGLITTEHLKLFAVVSTISLTLLTAFNVVGLANNVARAWRHLSVAILNYEAGVITIKDLLIAYKESELILGQFSFNYTPSQQLTPQTDNQSAVGETNELFNNATGKKLIEDAVSQVKARNDPRVLGVGSLPRQEDGRTKYYLHLNVTDEQTKKDYEDNFKINNNNIAFTPPMNIIITDQAKSHSNKLPGAGIKNVDGINGNGTFGCVVKTNDTKQNCVLSCQHVLKVDTNYNSDDYSLHSTISLSDGSNDKFAQHIKGCRSHEIDAGLAVLTDQLINNKNFGDLEGERDTTDYDIIVSKKVSLKGYNPQHDPPMTIPQYGVVINNKFDIDLDYDDGSNEKFTIQNAIVLSKSNTELKAISCPGYSGAIVIDDDRCIIGMVVGADDKFTYAIPINKIKDQLNFSILK